MLTMALIGAFVFGFLAGIVFTVMFIGKLLYDERRDAVLAGMFTFENAVYSVKRVEAD